MDYTSDKISKKEDEKIFRELEEIKFSESEAINLIERLEKGPNKQAKKFIEKSVRFYEEMKRKEQNYKNKKGLK